MNPDRKRNFRHIAIPASGLIYTFQIFLWSDPARPDCARACGFSSDRRVCRIVVPVPASHVFGHGLSERILFGASVEDDDRRPDRAVVVDVFRVPCRQADASVGDGLPEQVVVVRIHGPVVLIAVVGDGMEQDVGGDVRAPLSPRGSHQLMPPELVQQLERPGRRRAACAHRAGERLDGRIAPEDGHCAG